MTSIRAPHVHVGTLYCIVALKGELVWPDVDVEWEEAQDICRELGGSLPSIRSARRNAEVIAFMQENGHFSDAWIGANDRRIEVRDFVFLYFQCQFSMNPSVCLGCIGDRWSMARNP